MQVSLNKAERRVIRKIAKYQLESLDKLLRDDTKEDITMWCIEGNVSREELTRSLERDVKTYERLMIAPNEFINLEDEDMSLVKHILHRYIRRPDMKVAKASLWRKMIYLNSFNFNPN